MLVQEHGRPNIMNLQSRYLFPCPLGDWGNLRFTATQGGTPRASRPAAVLAYICGFLSELKFHLSFPTAYERGVREYAKKVRKHSRCIGNVLGSLTAPACDAKAQARVVRELRQLNELSLGQSSMLTRWPLFLEVHLDAMNYQDLAALRDGVLGNAESRKALSDALLRESGNVRRCADNVLHLIGKAADRKLACKVAREPLSRISRMPLSSSLDEDELAIQLLALQKNFVSSGTNAHAAAVSVLNAYFGSLICTESAALVPALCCDRLHVARKSLSLRRDSLQKQQALSALDSLIAALECEIELRIRPDLQQLQEKMRRIEAAQDQRAAFKFTYELERLRRGSEHRYRWIPENTRNEMQRLRTKSVFMAWCALPSNYVPPRAPAPIRRPAGWRP
ncbi:hypothetical protein [Alcaligenes sp. WGS1538]|uniref:hypothetical protein n=1 Tax=Alcaligenes sp. WGS1538 TaxID=3366811 RepID=UPI00372D6ACE